MSIRQRIFEISERSFDVKTNTGRTIKLGLGYYRNNLWNYARTNYGFRVPLDHSIPIFSSKWFERKLRNTSIRGILRINSIQQIRI
jgi:hypothetical protein